MTGVFPGYIAARQTFRLLPRMYRVSDADFEHDFLGPIVSVLGIAEPMRVPAHKLSLGQRMRCELAAALLRRSQILFASALSQKSWKLKVAAPQLAATDVLVPRQGQGIEAPSGSGGGAALASPQVQVSLHEVMGAAKEGLLAQAVSVRLGLLRSMLEAEVTAIVGPKGKHNRSRQANRHGTEQGCVVLGGRKVAIRRPRVRSTDGQEVKLATYEAFHDEELLTAAALERMIHGLSTRRYGHGHVQEQCQPPLRCRHPQGACRVAGQAAGRLALPRADARWHRTRGAHRGGGAGDHH